MTEQIRMFEDDGAEYREFVDKFKPKRTTDDCMTPENIWEAVAEWVAGEYGLDSAAFLRPFWPGADYERETYREGCVVVDNSPFSILARIQRFYIAREVPFFLFAPTLTLFSGRWLDVCYIPVGVQITYTNGAKVNTSFVTSLDGARLRTAPELYRRLRAVNDLNKRARTRELPRYSYPAHVLTAAAAYQFSHYGIDFRVERDECRFISGLDAQRASGKSIFGGAMLLSERAAAERAAAERAAAERAAAERAAAEVWALSPREREMVRRLSARERRAGRLWAILWF